MVIPFFDIPLGGYINITWLVLINSVVLLRSSERTSGASTPNQPIKVVVL